jgi:hypothetical protein
MKHLLLALAALLIVPPALAAEPAPAKPAAQAHAEGAVKAKPARKKAAVRAGKRQLPSGDLRQCLGLKSNEEVIKCAEAR